MKFCGIGTREPLEKSPALNACTRSSATGETRLSRRRVAKVETVTLSNSRVALNGEALMISLSTFEDWMWHTLGFGPFAPDAWRYRYVRVTHPENPKAQTVHGRRHDDTSIAGSPSVESRSAKFRTMCLRSLVYYSSTITLLPIPAIVA